MVASTRCCMSKLADGSSRGDASQIEIPLATHSPVIIAAPALSLASITTVCPGANGAGCYPGFLRSSQYARQPLYASGIAEDAKPEGCRHGGTPSHETAHPVVGCVLGNRRRRDYRFGVHGVHVTWYRGYGPVSQDTGASTNAVCSIRYAPHGSPPGNRSVHQSPVRYVSGPGDSFLLFV
jgi:hypothetical protein